LLPNGGELIRQVDLAGRRRRDDMPDGSWTKYRYDADGNPSSIEHSDGQRVDYDVRAHGWTARTAHVTTELAIDANGMPVAIEQRVDGITMRAEYRHGEDGRPPAIRYPGAADWLEVVPDGPGAVALRIGGVSYARAEAAGDTTTVTFANGATTVERLAGGRLVEVSAQGSDGARTTQAVGRDATGTITEVAGMGVMCDDAGRLSALGDDRWAYDSRGRLVRGPDVRIGYGAGPMARRATGANGRWDFTYDQLGRRAAATNAGDTATTTTYEYDLFGQLAGAQSEHVSVGYRHDGWGRLVARRACSDATYTLIGVDGHRLVDVDADGHVTASYLWLGEQCIGRVDGPLGAPLAAAFHRDPTGRPLAWSDETGVLQPNSPGDAFGHGAQLAWNRPGPGGLFGDPETGLLLAGVRWLDPRTAQFLTPDGWFGEDPAEFVPAALRRALDAAPGGTACRLSAVDAYAWCRYRPLELTDPTGHNWLGLIYSTISSLLWGVQATSASFQMWMIDFIIDVAQVLVFRPAWDTDGYWERSVYNIPAPTASYRLMVPWALWLNGMMRGPRPFTLGNVVWYSGTQLSDLESVSERGRVVGDVIAEFATATDTAAVDVMRTRNRQLLLTGDASASPVDTITDVGVTLPIGGPGLGAVLAVGDVVSVRVFGAATDELRKIAAITAPDLTLDPALPDSFAGQAVDIRRVDAGVMRLSNGDATLARTIAIIRGSSAHVARPVPDEFFSDNDVTVEEFLPAPSPRLSLGTVVSEQLVVTFASGDDLGPYVANDVVRLLTAGFYVARLVTGTRTAPTAELVLDTSMPPGVHTAMEVARLTASGESSAPGQAVTGARLGVTGLANLAAREGVAVTDAGGAVQRRIVTGLVLDCTVPTAPVAVVGIASFPVAVVRADPAVTANGTAETNTTIKTSPGQAATFTAGQPVEVTAGGTAVRRLITTVDAGTDTLTLEDGHGFAAATAVTVTLMKTTPADTFSSAEPISGVGNHVLVTVPSFDVITAGATLLLGTGANKALRDVGAAAPLADLDSALPASHATNVSVDRLTVDTSSIRNNAAAPLTKIRVTFTPAPSFTVGETVHVAKVIKSGVLRGEELIDTVAEVRGGEIVLEHHTGLNISTAGDDVTVQAVVATGSTGDATLHQSLVLIPSDPDEDPYPRRDALENHEMRHVWQYALWGPFFLSLPIPWLLHVGFSFSPLANSEESVVRHIGMGGLDSLFALLFWGIGGSKTSTTVDATVGGGRKTLTLKAAAAASEFASGYRIEVSESGRSEFAVVDAIAGTTLTLRWALPDVWPDGDDVTVLVSPFEQVRKTVSTWFSLNFENLWHDHIPATWGRALSAVANRDSWLPGLGLYVLTVIAAEGDQSRTPFEQDAAYASGDLYTSITTSDPASVFTGQFSRVFAFVDTRYDSRAAGIANPIQKLKNQRTGAAEQLSVSATGGGAMINAIAGSQPALSGSRVKFRENWLLPLKDEIGNALGALFAASAPGTYRLHAPGELVDEGVVMAGLASVGALETRTITVKPVTVAPDPAQHLFETEQRTFSVLGDLTAQYGLRGVGGAAPSGVVSGLTYTAWVLPAGTPSDTDELELTATYAADHPVFRGAGQLDEDNLLDEQRTNVCQAVTLTVDELTVTAPGPLTAGTSVDIAAPISPASIDVAAPSDPAAVTGELRVLDLGGRPATLRILAPAAVSAAVDIGVTLNFGTDPAVTKAIPLTIQITPA
jgi:YD repeat-containing protein